MARGRGGARDTLTLRVTSAVSARCVSPPDITPQGGCQPRHAVVVDGGVASWPKHDLAARATMVCGARQGAGHDRKGAPMRPHAKRRRAIAAGLTAACASLAAPIGIGLLGETPASAAPTCQFTTHGSTMTLNADCVTTQTITVPGGTTLNGSGHTITATDPMGTQFVGPVIVSGGSVMNVEKLTIAGHFTNGTCNSSAGTNSPALLRGVEFVDASGIVKKVTVTGMNKGAGNTCTEGNAIVANDETGGPYNLTIEHDTVSGYQGLGVYVQGVATANVSHDAFTEFAATGDTNSFGMRIVSAHGATISHDSVSTASNAYAAIDIQGTNGVAISHVTLTSPGSAQGIYEDALSGGSISHSTVTAGSSSFAAVNLDETTGVTVSHTNAHGALVVYTNCAVLPNASNNTLTHNTVRGAAFGIQITADSNGSSTCPSNANGNTVSHNTISDPGGTVGINIFVTTGGPFVCQADHNVIESNTITGFSQAIGDGGSNTVIAHNRT
jgi:hypothetical protein